MEKEDGIEFEQELLFSDTTGSDLRGRQSIRATFKLTAGCIDAISIVAKHLGIKQKSLFDHLAEDTHALKTIARQARDARLKSLDRVQKTFVISRRSLNSIEMVSKHFNAPRDALVEFSVQRLLPIIEAERKKHEKRKAFISDIHRHYNAGLSLMDKVGQSLGGEDPLFSSLSSVMNQYRNALAQMVDFVEKGKIIEEFDPDSLGQILNNLTR